MKHLKKLNENLNEEGGGVLLARYGNNDPEPVRVEIIPADFDDEDMVDEVSQQFGTAVVYSMDEMKQVMAKLKELGIQ